MPAYNGGYYRRTVGNYVFPIQVWRDEADRLVGRRHNYVCKNEEEAKVLLDARFVEGEAAETEATP